jgi:hypothetical protein
VSRRGLLVQALRHLDKDEARHRLCFSVASRSAADSLKQAA